MGIIKISEVDEWARHLRELVKQAGYSEITLSGRIVIESQSQSEKIEIEL